MGTIGAPLRSMRVSSPYGPRPPGPFHSGVDLVAPAGTPVLAAAAGSARRAANGGGGWGVIIDHGGGLTTEYWHLSSRTVGNFGQVVAAGQLIGLSGASGVVTGPHLHFEVKVNGQTVDPMRVIGGIGNSSLGWGAAAVAGAKQSLPRRIPKPPGGCPPDYHPVGEGGFFDTSEGACELNDDLWDAINDPGWAASQVIPELFRVDLSGTLAPALNIGVVVAAVVIGWGGVKKVIGG